MWWECSHCGGRSWIIHGALLCDWCGGDALHPRNGGVIEIDDPPDDEDALLDWYEVGLEWTRVHLH